jgi:hypothetical protein
MLLGMRFFLKSQNLSGALCQLVMDEYLKVSYAVFDRSA